MTRNRFWAVCIFFVIFAAAIVYATIAACRQARVGIEAERTHHAYILTLNLLEAYAEQHPREPWPDSWDELAEISYDVTHAGWHWPHDHREIAQRVFIDFSLSPEDLLDVGSAGDSGKAVHPRPPSFGTDERRFAAVVSAVSAAVTGNR